jgi:hypothetical protein
MWLVAPTRKEREINERTCEQRRQCDVRGMQTEEDSVFPGIQAKSSSGQSQIGAGRSEPLVAAATKPRASLHAWLPAQGNASREK